MSIYVVIDVHRKRSQVAVVAEGGRVQLNRNVVHGSQPMLGPLGGLPRVCRRRSRRLSAGDGWRAH